MVITALVTNSTDWNTNLKRLSFETVNLYLVYKTTRFSVRLVFYYIYLVGNSVICFVCTFVKKKKKEIAIGIGKKDKTVLYCQQEKIR